MKDLCKIFIYPNNRFGIEFEDIKEVNGKRVYYINKYQYNSEAKREWYEWKGGGELWREKDRRLAISHGGVKVFESITGVDVAPGFPMTLCRPSKLGVGKFKYNLQQQKLDYEELKFITQPNESYLFELKNDLIRLFFQIDRMTVKQIM